MKSKGYSLFQVVIIILITSIISGVATGVIITKSFVNNSGVSYSDLLQDENVQEFLSIYSSLNDDYYENIDKSAIIDSAIEGMTNYLNETYTTYLDQEQTSSLMNQLEGTYNGIGIVLNNKTVTNVVVDSSAEEAGIQVGDVLVKVNNEDITNMSNTDIASLISSNDDGVDIEVLRNNEPMDITLKVSTLKVPSTSYYITDDNIGYLKISIFGNGVSDEVKKAIDYFDENSVKGIIIDLRDNNGGYLQQAYETASLFLKQGKVIYYIENDDKKTAYKDKTKSYYQNPIVVLINGETASAAEILASSLIESAGASSVGTKSYGKGKVQHTYKTNSGGLVKYTSSLWLTPTENCIDGIGITPKLVVENTNIYDESGNTIVDVVDNQYNEAIKLLNN